MSLDVVSLEVARRYLLGRQGLWPGRRWAGKEGVANALHALGAVQIDPVTIIARSHDLVLWSRVDGYDPEHLQTLLYRERAFFDYGGHLDIYPMEELPYWRLHMQRRRADPKQASFAAEHAALLDEIRAEVRQRGPVGNRDFQGNARVSSYRGRKDTALALYYLWLTGELMTHGRRGAERLYDLRERVAASNEDETTEAEAERFFAEKTLTRLGLGDARSFRSTLAYAAHRKIDRKEASRWLDDLAAEGIAAQVSVDGIKAPYFVPATEVPLIAALCDGDVPKTWRPLGATTTEEATLLSPLDNLLRFGALFDFEHLWEIYKPAERRRWGAYTMPILYQDRLVGRLDPKLDRKTGTLIINGVWLEEGTTARDDHVFEALANGLGRFARFHDAHRLDLTALDSAPLRKRIQAAITL